MMRDAGDWTRKGKGETGQSPARQGVQDAKIIL